MLLSRLVVLPFWVELLPDLVKPRPVAGLALGVTTSVQGRSSPVSESAETACLV